MRVKQIDWSYPTSPNAERFKMPVGCWTLSFQEGHKPPVAVTGFNTLDEAVAEARLYPEPFGSLWAKYETDAYKEETEYLRCYSPKVLDAGLDRLMGDIAAGKAVSK